MFANNNRRKYSLLKAARLLPLKKQIGLTLTELMVSLCLGLLLSATLTRAYLSSAQTDILLHEQSLMQENARFAFYFIGDNIRHAGFLGSTRGLDKRLHNTAIAFNDLGFIFKQAEHGVVGFDNEEFGPAGARKNTDQLFIRYQGIQAGAGEDTPLTDCLGVKLDDKEIVQIRYYLGENAARNSLLCASYIEGRKKAYQAQPIIDQVKDLQFLYGLDINNDGASNMYVPAGDQRLNGKENNWGNVVAVKMKITLQSGRQEIEKEFTQTIWLRNRHVY